MGLFGVSPFGHIPGERELGLLAFHRSGRCFGDQDTVHKCYAVLPCVLSWESQVALWANLDETISKEAEFQRPYRDETGMREWEQAERAKARKARVHAFDIEAGLFVSIVGARAGFSPGEFVDFLLGWFGIDIAGDDRAVATEGATAVRSRGSASPPGE